MRRFFSILLVFLAVVTGAASAPAWAQAHDIHVADAMKLVDLGNARDAAEQLRQMIATDPKNAEAHAGLAIALITMNQPAEALTEAQAGFDLDRHDAFVRIARGTVYGKQGRISDALDEFHQAIKIDPKDVGSMVALSRYYISIDSLKSGEITLYQAQGLNAKDVRSYLGLAELYERQHIPELAIGQYQQAMKLDPTDERVHTQLAGLYLRTRKYNESAKEWLEVIRIDSNYADAYYQIANLYFLAKQYTNAASFAGRYVKLRPNDINGQWLYARALTEAGQYQQALPALQAVASNDSLRALSQLLLARSYFYSKDYPKALDIYRNAKTLSPLDIKNYAAILILQGDTAGGIEQYKKALQVDSVSSSKDKIETQVTIANLLYKQKKFEEASQIFSDMAKANPSVHWYLCAGEACVAAKKPDLAKKYYAQALGLDSNSLEVHYQMAFADLSINAGTPESREDFEKLDSIAKKTGNADTAAMAEGFMAYDYAAHQDWQGAADYLEPAIKVLEGKSSEFLPSFELLLAQSYGQLREFAKAKEWYEKVLKLDPNNEDAKKGLDYLKQATPGKK